MSKKIITISRQCGSGGHTVGKLVSERLGIPFYDKKLIEIVAQRSGLTEETIAREGEFAPASLLYSIAMNLSHGYDVRSKGNMILPDQINTFQTELIKELAEKGPCVIVGRCANYILHDRSDCLHVYLHGDMEERKNRVVAEHRVLASEAEAHIRDRDRKRAKHYEHFTDQRWGMAQNYTICLDSSVLGIEKCVETIEALSK